MTTELTESFPALTELPGIQATFLRRLPGVDVDGEREEVLARLKAPQRALAEDVGFAGMPLATAEQVHDNNVAVVDETSAVRVPGVDGLLTATPGLCLGIYVADCAAVYLADRRGRAIGLIHSGKKGTEFGICTVAVQTMNSQLGIAPRDLVAVISPCIRPPHYELDFAKQIQSQLQQAGVGTVVDSGTCTASHPDLYYSYRRERGRTGRMLALMAITNQSGTQ
jgi:copper oxidase (laccase) domain-containing protein